MTYRLTAWAGNQVELHLTYGEQQFGRVHRHNYQSLIVAAMEDPSANPGRVGTTAIPGCPGCGVYELQLAKNLVPRQARVRNPWHKIIYRRLPDGVVEILAVTGLSYPADKAAREALS